MHVNDLPLSTLRSAIALAAQPLLVWHGDWRRALRLLHVCACWRGVAMAEVYRQLYVFCIEPDGADDSDDEADDAAFRAIRTESSLPPLMAWHTNANLVAAIGGAAQLVREVRVNLRGPAYLFPFLAGVAQQLAPLPLARVEALGIHLASDYVAPDASSAAVASIDQAGAMEEAAALSDAFFRLLPRVSRLRVTGLDGSEAFCRFADRLSYHYALGLRRLEAHYPLSCMAPALGSALSFLHLQVRPYIGQLVPHIVPRSLRHLCLDGISPWFRWQCFYENEGTARNIRFACLEHLYVHYNGIAGMDVDAVVTADYYSRANRPPKRRRAGNGTLSDSDRPFWLAFPSLRTLALTRCPDSGGLLSCSSFPSDSLASVTLDGPPGAVRALAALVASRRVTRVGELSVFLRTTNAEPSDSRNEADADDTTAAVAGAGHSISTSTAGSSAAAGDLATALGRLLSDLRVDGAGVLCLFGGGGADPTVDNIVIGSNSSSMARWAHLTELTIDAPLSLAAFVAIIRAQPQLTSLACYTVQITAGGGGDSGIADTDDHDDCGGGRQNQRVEMKNKNKIKLADCSLLLENIIELIDDMMNDDDDDDGGPINDTLANAMSGPNDGDQFTSQLATGLERIVLCNYVDLFSQRAALSLACWLMLSVRSLKYILVSRLNLGHAAAFVRRMETRYPHLKNIDINTS
ncbi:hypothetical protein IWW48_004429 [Coemansia sp. RSA 1200]|nr:hypothetical protein IWW48_004429 [Coemansia sp. RSA 1200]